MKRGQVFILIAFVIGIMLSELGNIYTYSNLPAQTEQSKVSETVDLFKNAQNEVVFVAMINPRNSTDLEDFVMILTNFSIQKSFILNFTRS